jgi:hypothetical protein
MLALLIIAFSSLTFGTGLLGLLRLRIDRFYLHGLLSLSSGLCIWMSLLFVLGHLRLFRSGILLGIAVPAAISALVILSFRRKRLRRIVRGVQGLPWWGRMYAAVVALILFITFIASFAPVVGGIRNDEICLHLSIVREWLSRGGIPVPSGVISYQAGNAHLLFLLAGALGSPAGQRLVSWLCFGMCLVAIFIIARSFTDKKNALLAVLMAAINPLVFRGAWVAFVDMPSSLFALLPVVALLEYRREKRSGWLILCALFLGAGSGIKPTNVLYGAAFCAGSLLFAATRRVSLKELLRAAAIILVLGGLMAAPWPTRTMILTGSPVFPPPLFLYKNGDLKPLSGDPAPFTVKEVKGYYDYVMSRYGEYRRNLLHFIYFPWDVTMRPGQFQIGDSIGTLFLCLLPCVFFFLHASGIMRFLLVMAGFAAASLYFLVVPEARYYIGVLMLLCPPLAAAVQALEKKKMPHTAVASIIVINCIFSLMVSLRITGPLMKAALNPAAAERMKREQIPFYEAFEYLRHKGITDVTVSYAPQNLYYLPKQTRYHVDNAHLANMHAMHGAYVLDFDYSQTLDRQSALIRGDYQVPATNLPTYFEMVFQGPDARIYRIR